MKDKYSKEEIIKYKEVEGVIKVMKQLNMKTILLLLMIEKNGKNI